MEKTAQAGSAGTGATKSIRSIADKIIARKTFSIQLIYCDNAKQAACNGKKLPMGSIQCGASYKVRYDHPVRSFEVTGPEKGSGQQTTNTYSGAKVEDGQVSLWGRFLTFDEEGDIFDSDCGRVGRLAFD